MKQLSPKELAELAMLLERANRNEQLSIGVESGFETQEIIGVCDNEDCLELLLKPSGLKWLWVRHNGAKGGLTKAKNAKKGRKPNK
jgi:hypothetical protein